MLFIMKLESTRPITQSTREPGYRWCISMPEIHMCASMGSSFCSIKYISKGGALMQSLWTFDLFKTRLKFMTKKLSIIISCHYA